MIKNISKEEMMNVIIKKFGFEAFETILFCQVAEDTDKEGMDELRTLFKRLMLC